MKKFIILLICLFVLTSCKDEHVHEYVEKIYEASCTTEGYTEYICECGDIYRDNIVPLKEHNYINRVCSVCNDINTKPSEKLQFELNDDQMSYSLIGIGECLDDEVIIPSIYNNLPVTRISDNAFLNNNKIKKLIIPESIISVGKNVLKGCNNIISLQIPIIYNGYIGYLFGAESSSYNNSYLPKTLKEITITNEESIKKNAFTNCTYIEKINIDQKLSVIENNAFYNCINLNEIILPSTLTQIKEKAFYNCENLNTVCLNGSYHEWFKIKLDSIYSNPMYYASVFNYIEDGCYKILTNLSMPNNLNNLNDYQLYGFDCIRQIYISDSLESIGIDALVGLTNLETYDVSPNNNFYKAEDGVLYSKDHACLVSYPSGKQDKVYNVNNMTSYIYQYAFAHNHYLEEVILSDGVIEIHKYAFSNMNNLKKVHITDNIKIISEGLFFNCSNLEEVYLPNGIKEIHTSAFEYCTNLENIFIPINVSVIQAYAFRNCTKLTIYCEADSKPNGWVSSYWNVYPSCPVYWSQIR